MKKEEFEIGEIFNVGLMKLKCVESTSGSCTGCEFWDPYRTRCGTIRGIRGWCTPDWRKDEKNVIFVKQD